MQGEGDQTEDEITRYIAKDLYTSLLSLYVFSAK